MIATLEMILVIEWRTAEAGALRTTLDGTRASVERSESPVGKHR